MILFNYTCTDHFLFRPGYNKNWLWRGDHLWFDRWQQLIMGELQPEFVEIISWNDYGER